MDEATGTRFRRLVAMEAMIADVAGLVEALVLLEEQLEPDSPERIAYAAIHGVLLEKTRALGRDHGAAFADLNPPGDPVNCR